MYTYVYMYMYTYVYMHLLYYVATLTTKSTDFMKLNDNNNVWTKSRHLDCWIVKFDKHSNGDQVLD